MVQPKAQQQLASPEKRSRRRWLTGALLCSCVATGYFLLNRLEMIMPIAELPAVLCVPSCDAEQAIHTPTATGTFINADIPLEEILGEPGEKDRRQVSLLVEKSQHRVTLYYNSQPMKSYEAVFGASPIGDKRFEGDRKTPEGIFRIHDLYPHEWAKFIWLDYPTPQSWRKHLRSKLTGEIGLGTTIGSEIGIHGVPEGADGFIDVRSNWTWGCVSLKNSDVDEIYEYVTQGSIVEIVP